MKGKPRLTTKFCPNPGIPQGYVKFGTVYHQILVHIHTWGRSDHRTIVDIEDLDSNVVGNALAKLLKHGYIHIVDLTHHSCTNGKRAWIYSTKKRHSSLPPLPGPLTPAQRTRAYRERKKLRVPSVFNFRGKINDFQHNID